MPFIKAQKILRNTNGDVIRGSASLVSTFYGDFGNYHAKHKVIEQLGKVLYLSEDNKIGIFVSPTRGLIGYNSNEEDFFDVDKNDKRIAHVNLFPEPRIHTVFGDCYLLLEFLNESKLLQVFRSTFPGDLEYERLLCHVLHSVLRDGANISCTDFIGKSFVSYLASDIPLITLESDTNFFTMMGDDHTKMAFFSAYIDLMRKSRSDFGRACYVDSTPLPNDIVNNPFNSLCSHGVNCSQVMCRLVLVLDEASGLPVWYDIIPGNVLDLNTLRNVTEDVRRSLDINIESYVLDAGYVTKELITQLCGQNSGGRVFIGRMPARKGFPHRECYRDVKSQLQHGKYLFSRNDHTYFGKKLDKRVFDTPVHTYVYVDEYNALKYFNKYLSNHEEEYEKLKEKDKDWFRVKDGFFVLISNIDDTPKNLLIDYYGRTYIESVFKTSKEYLRLLPLSKWTDTTIRGKILHDIINTIVLLTFRKDIGDRDNGYSIPSIFGKASSQMCFLDDNGLIVVETPNKQTKQMYSMLKVKPPMLLSLSEYRAKIFQTV